MHVSFSFKCYLTVKEEMLRNLNEQKKYLNKHRSKAVKLNKYGQTFNPVTV